MTLISPFRAGDGMAPSADEFASNSPTWSRPKMEAKMLLQPDALVKRYEPRRPSAVAAASLNSDVDDELANGNRDDCDLLHVILYPKL